MFIVVILGRPAACTADDAVERTSAGNGNQECDGGRDRRVDVQMQAVPDAHGQCLRANPGKEQRDDQLVKRCQEAKERSRSDAGKGEGNDDLA